MKLFGMSGIFKQYSFYKDHPHLPFDQDSKRSCYHTRQLELIRGLLLDERVDIGISHDWPRGAHKFGNYEELIKVKPYFEKDVKFLFIKFSSILEGLEILVLLF